jgi:hypothetical protein
MNSSISIVSSSAGSAIEATMAADMAQITTTLAAVAAQMQQLQARLDVIAPMPSSAALSQQQQQQQQQQRVESHPLHIPGASASSSSSVPSSSSLSLDQRRQNILGINPEDQRAAEGYIREILSGAPEQKVDPINNAHVDMPAVIDDFGVALSPAVPGDQSIRLESFLTAAIADAAKTHKTFKSVQDFADALESHRRSVMAKPGVNSEQLSRLQTYITYVLTMCAEHGLAVAQNYHFAVAKHIAAGTHSLYRDGHYHAAAYAQYVIPAIIAASSAFSASSRTKKATATNRFKRQPTAKPTSKHPTGSCKNHPWSTTHTTEECRAAK